jgi:hypothetical protein
MFPYMALRAIDRPRAFEISQIKKSIISLFVDPEYRQQV